MEGERRTIDRAPNSPVHDVPLLESDLDMKARTHSLREETSEPQHGHVGLRSHSVPVLPAVPDLLDEKPVQFVLDDPWSDVDRIQPTAKKEEPSESVPLAETRPAVGPITSVSSPKKAEDEDEHKPPQSHTDEDPWSDIIRVQPLAKKEEFHDAELVSSSETQSGSSLERGLKRSRSSSTLSSLSSDFGPDSADVTRRQRPRYSQSAGLAQQLRPVSFDKTGRPRVLLDCRVEVKPENPVLRTVMFNASDDSEVDVNMPTADVGLPGNDPYPIPPFFDDQDAPPFLDNQDANFHRSPPPPPGPSATPPPARSPAAVAVRVKPEPIDDDIVILNTVSRENLATDVKVKIKKDRQLDEVTIRDRLVKANATVPFEVELDEVVRNVLVSRGYMSSFFGGSPQGMTPPVAKKMYDLPGRGRNDFLYINRELHPNAPSAPGEHGVWQPNIVCWYRDPKDDPFMAPFMEKKIPVKDEPGIEVVPKVEDVERKPDTKKGKGKKKPTPKSIKKAPENTTGIYTTLVGGFEGQQGRKWLYIGQCQPVDEDTLRLDDWLLWDNKVRLAWADNLVKGEWGVWVRFRARYRRKYNREPTKTEMHHWWALVQAKVERLDDWTADRYLIKEDMDLGKECLTIGVVKCVGYDAAFQRQIARDIESYVPPPRKPKGSHKGKKDEDVEMLEESDVDMGQPGPSTSKTQTKKVTSAKKVAAKKTGVANNSRKGKGKRRTSPSPSPSAVSDVEMDDADDGSDLELEDILPDWQRYRGGPTKSRSKPFEVM